MTHRIFLAGNPNCGKSTLFNQLTGLRQKTGNYSGVTVEKKTGTVVYEEDELEIIDMPGAYSLHGVSEDKQVIAANLVQRKQEDRILFIADASVLERSLQFFFQTAELGCGMILVLTMNDILEKRNLRIDAEKLSRLLNVKVILSNPKKGEGINELKECIRDDANFQIPELFPLYESGKQKFFDKVLNSLHSSQNDLTSFALRNSFRELSGERISSELPSLGDFSEKVREFIKQEFTEYGKSFTYQEEMISRSMKIREIIASCTSGTLSSGRLSWTEKADRLFLHPVGGFLFFFFIMALVFQLLFTWSEVPIQWIESLTDLTAKNVQEFLPPGPVSALVSEGLIKGAGTVLAFIPQIALLFFFILMLEETGYMSRASFLMDRLMGRFGLSGKSFIPLLSSAACAVPAILGTKTIENRSDRLITIFASPLITCSARYPVYTLLISTVFPDESVFGFVSLKGLVLLGLFFLGMTASVLTALIMKRTFFRNDPSYFIQELPFFRFPSVKSTFLDLYGKIKEFIINTGMIIIYASAILWFLLNFPNEKKNFQPDSAAREEITLNSYAAAVGKTVEPVIRPLGFDWKIGISILGAFSAREVMVSTLAVIYGTDEKNEKQLSSIMKEQKREDGSALWSMATGCSLLVFFAFA
ncbi:MAG TPA: ferrous iron transport protein B, partial [Leptospiraceae bacterium]|nr:ferrous iron transport protein B [Leptospiraceae bacterium]